MRLLISGYYGFDNLGDEAILAALLQELRERHPDWTPVVLSHKPSDTEATYDVPAVARDSLLCLWEEMGRADLLISGGGGLLQNVTSQLSLLYYLGILELALRRGTPYVVLGQGLGPFFGPGVLRLVRRYLRRAQAVVLRDADSVRLAREMGLPAEGVTEAADLALLLRPASAEIAQNLLRAVGLEAGGPLCGVIVRAWGGQEPEEATAALCDHLQEELGIRCLLLPFQPPDLPLAWRVVARTRSQPAVLDQPVLPAEMLSLVGRLGMVVSMRLHGLIFAAAQQVPALGLSYDPKVTAFALQAGQKALPLAHLTGQALSVAAQDLWKNREAGAKQRAEAAARLRNAAEVNLRVLEAVAEKVAAKEG